MSNGITEQQGSGRANRSIRRRLFRLGGVCFLLAGLACAVIAGIDFFGSVSSDLTQTDVVGKFWMFFVALPLLLVGAVLLQLGFAGAGARYLAGEYLPVVKESMDQLGLRGDALHAAGDGPYCRSCGKQNGSDARFCASCGSATGR